METKSLNLCMNKYVVHCVLINKMEFIFFFATKHRLLLLKIQMGKCQSVLSKEMYILLFFF